MFSGWDSCGTSWKLFAQQHQSSLYLVGLQPKAQVKSQTIICKSTEHVTITKVSPGCIPDLIASTCVGVNGMAFLHTQAIHRYIRDVN